MVGGLAAADQSSAARYGKLVATKLVGMLKPHAGNDTGIEDAIIRALTDAVTDNVKGAPVASCVAVFLPSVGAGIMKNNHRVGLLAFSVHNVPALPVGSDLGLLPEALVQAMADDSEEVKGLALQAIDAASTVNKEAVKTSINKCLGTIAEPKSSQIEEALFAYIH